MDRDTLISELGLKAEATDEEINTAFANMKTSAAEKKPDPPADPTDDAPDDNTDGDDTVESLAEKVNSLATRLDERDAAGEKARISSLVDGAIADRKILPRDKETYLRSASADFDATKKTLGAIKNNTVAPDSVTVSDGSKPQESDSRFVASRDTGMMKYVNEQQGV